MRATIVGRVLGCLCHVTGWLAPMYGAGRLESRNIREYELAARFARDADRAEFIDCLLEMAEVEWEHENYFRSRVLDHWLGRRLSLWPSPPPKDAIRKSFANNAYSEAEKAEALQGLERVEAALEPVVISSHTE